MNMQSYPIRVLLIDAGEDDCIVARDLISALSFMEFILKKVPDYGAALDAILSGEFDVCLLSCRLKGRNGLELLQEAVSRGASTPVVFLTDRGGCGQELEAMGRGAADCLTEGELSAPVLERSIHYAIRTAELAKVNAEFRIKVEELGGAGEAFKAEQALRANEAKFRSYIESAPLGVFVADERGRLVDFNPAAADLLGYDDATLRKMHILDLHPEEDHEEVLGQFATLLKTGRMVTERRMKKCDGRLIWVSLHTALISNQFSLGYCQDITERRRMEEALRESEARLRQIIDLVPHRIFVKSWDGKYLLANKTAAESYNTSVSGLIGKYHADFHPDECEVQNMLQDDREVITRGEVKFIAEEPFTDARGNLHFMQTTKVPFHILGEKSPAVLGVAIDITDNKRAEEVLRESETKYRFISENTGDVIWQYDLDTDRFVYCSPSIYRLAGLPPEEVVGRNMGVLLTPASMQNFRKRVPEAIAALNAGDESFRLLTDEVDLMRKDGSVVPIEAVTTLIQDAAGRVAGLIGVTRNTTEQRRAAEALRESETRFRTLFDTMMEGVSLHEIIYDERGKAVDYRIISTNPAFEKHTGLKSEQVLGQLASKVYGFGKAPYLERYALVASSGEPDSFETSSPVINRFFHVSATSPKRGYFLTVFENITERKRAEEALRDSEARLKIAMDLAKLAQWEYDVKTGMFTFDDQFYALYGTTSEQRGAADERRDLCAKVRPAGGISCSRRGNRQSWQPPIPISRINWNIG